MAGTTPNSSNVGLLRRGTSYLTPLGVHPEYDYWRPDWAMIRDVIAGEREIKKKQTAYLPRMEGSTDDDYAAYLHNAVFYNMTRQTLNGMAGQLFRRDPAVRNVPTKLKPKLRRFGKDGSPHEVIAKTLIREQIAVGRVGVLVDAPLEGGLTPEAYVTVYTTENIIDWTVEANANGMFSPTRVLLREFKLSQTGPESARLQTTGSSYQYITMFRELILINGEYHMRTYQENPAAAPLTDVVPRIRGQALSFIPFVFFGAESNAADVEGPPLLDIARLNLSHYKTYADLEHGRKFTALPVYYAPGNEGEGASEYHIGPNVVWETPPDQTPGILEFTGTGLRSLETALTTKEQQIAAIGGRMMPGASRSISESNNQSSLREANEHALLLSVVKAAKVGMTMIIRIWCAFLDAPLATTEDLRYDINTDYLTMVIGARELRAIQLMYEGGIIPIETLYTYLQTAEVIPSDWTLEDFTERLKDPESFFNSPDSLAKLRGYDTRQQELEQTRFARDADQADVELAIKQETADKLAPVTLDGAPPIGVQLRPQPAPKGPVNVPGRKPPGAV